MRASFSRWSVVGAVIGSLLLGVSGCKSGAMAPTDWLGSWGKKPPPTALTSTTPKPSKTGLPSPRTTAGGQTGLASKSYQNYGNQGYPVAPGTSSPGNYTTGPYGMASHSTSPAPQATSPYGGSNQYAANNTPPYGAATSPYAATGAAQPGAAQPGAAQPGADAYRTADARSGASSTYGQPASGYGGQPAYTPGPSSQTQPAAQNWNDQTPSYPTAGATDTTGLNNSAGPFQPGSTGNTGALPTGGATNLKNTSDYPGTTPPTNPYGATGTNTGAGSYPGATSGATYPATPAASYPPAGSTSYPTTGGASPGYASPYSSNGY